MAHGDQCLAPVPVNQHWKILANNRIIPQQVKTYPPQKKPRESLMACTVHPYSEEMPRPHEVNSSVDLSQCPVEFPTLQTSGTCSGVAHRRFVAHNAFYVPCYWIVRRCSVSIYVAACDVTEREPLTLGETYLLNGVDFFTKGQANRPITWTLDFTFILYFVMSIFP